MSSIIQQGRYDSVFSPEASQFYDLNQRAIRQTLPSVLEKLSGSNPEENFAIAQREITHLIPGIDSFPKLVENVAANFILYSNRPKSS